MGDNGREYYFVQANTRLSLSSWDVNKNTEIYNSDPLFGRVRPTKCVINKYCQVDT